MVYMIMVYMVYVFICLYDCVNGLYVYMFVLMVYMFMGVHTVL